MTPSSITIRIDFGAEGVGSAGSSGVAVSGGVPTPSDSGGAAAGATAQGGGVAPTPFDHGGQMLVQAEAVVPAPSPTLVPAGVATSSGGVGSGDVPTPVSAGGGGSGVPGSAVDAPPTPFDSVDAAAGEQAPTPQGDARADDEPTGPIPSLPGDGSPRKGRK
jgi:hypothetical protein